MDGGMLSQDEINALLNGMNTSDNSTDEGNASTEPESGTGTDPAEVALEVIEAYPDGFFCRRIRTQS